MTDLMEPAGLAQRVVRAGVMARVSTREQAIERKTGVRKTSIDAQLEQGRAYCMARLLEVADQYADEGASGTTLERQELQRALADARAGRLDVLVFTKWDRLARKLEAGIDLIALLNGLGVELVVIEGGFDSSTPIGKAIVRIFLIFAELQRDTIVEQLAVGQRNKAIAGGWPGGMPGYGYRQVGHGASARLALHQDEAAMLRLATDWIVDEGLNRPAAAKRLNIEGYRQRNGKPWTPDNLSDVLENPSLKGEMIWGGSRRASGQYGEPVTVQLGVAVLTTERWDALQQATRSNYAAPRASRPYPLGNKSMTSPCGQTYNGAFRHSSGRRWYQCRGSLWSADPERVRCGCPNLRADQLDDRVFEQVRLMLTDSGRLRALAGAWLDLQGSPQAGDSVDRLPALRKQAAKLDRALTQTVVDYARQGLPATAVQAATDAIEADLAGLRGRIAAIEAAQADRRATALQLDALGSLADRAQQRLASADRATQAELMRALQVRATVLDTGRSPRVRVSGSVPVPPAGQSLRVAVPPAGGRPWASPDWLTGSLRVPFDLVA